MTADRLRVGDVFVIPLDVDHNGFGQVVARYLAGSVYIAIFETISSGEVFPPLADIVSAHVAFLALSHDAKIRVGDWSIIGNAPVSKKIPFPAYKEMVGGPERVDVVDYTGKKRRRATRAETERLPNRTLVAPMLLEKALLAAQGLSPWVEEFATLRPPAPDATSAHVFADS